ncbi:MAG: tetratricopeptide repeat protein, partial [Planctomycetota bacterium]
MKNSIMRGWVISLLLLLITNFSTANFKKKPFEKILTNIYKGAIREVENRITRILQNVKKEEYKNILLFLRAYSAYTRFLFDDAQRTCEEVLSKNPLQRECLWLVFRVHMEKGDIEKAKEAVENIHAKISQASSEDTLPLTYLSLLVKTTFLYNSYEYERFLQEGRRVYQVFIKDKKYKQLNIFEIEELGYILYNLYQRTGDKKYLKLVLYFEEEDKSEEESPFSEKKAADIVEYLIYKNKFNINAYLMCANVAYENDQRKTIRECIRLADRINRDHPQVRFYVILINFRQLLNQNMGQLITNLENIANSYPNFYPPHLLLAITYQIVGNLVRAEESAFKALRLHKDDIIALGILYRLFKMRNNNAQAREILERIKKNKFKYAEFLYEIGLQIANIARWPEAQKYLARAYRLDKNNMKILKEYAVNLSRMKKEKSAYKLIKKYVKMNPFDKEVINVFNLLTKIKNDFSVIKTKNFVIKLHKRLEYEVEVPVYDDTLMPFYIEEVAEKALKILTERYGINLPTPIHLELLTDSEDLAVRTFGLPIMGVLGSCFGSFLTTLSPKARFDLPVPFSWAAVFWHELSHSFHLYLSDFKVPRWFTEGLATYEEVLADPRWAEHNILPVYYAYKQRGLPTLQDLILNRAQVRNVRLVFYDYGAIIQEYLHKTYGFGKIIELLKLWKSKISSEEVFTYGLGKSVEEISDEFNRFLENKFRNIKILVPAIDEHSLRPLLHLLRVSPRTELNRNQLELLANYAYFLLNTDKKNARKFARIVLERDKNNSIATFVEGIVYRELDLDNKKAKENLLKAIDNGFNSSAVYRVLGTIYYEDGDYLKAEEYLLRAIEAFPYYQTLEVDDNPYLLLGKIYE